MYRLDSFDNYCCSNSPTFGDNNQLYKILEIYRENFVLSHIPENNKEPSKGNARFFRNVSKQITERKFVRGDSLFRFLKHLNILFKIENMGNLWSYYYCGVPSMEDFVEIYFNEGSGEIYCVLNKEGDNYNMTINVNTIRKREKDFVSNVMFEIDERALVNKYVF